MIEWTDVIEKEPGPPLRMDCPNPKCRRKNILCITYTLHTKQYLYGIIRLSNKVEQKIICKACMKAYDTFTAWEELEQVQSEELPNYFVKPIGFVPTCLSFVAFAISWFPLIGLVFSLVVVGMIYGKVGWARYVAWTSLTISLILHIGLIILFAFDILYGSSGSIPSTC